jgi:hypothetical protein
MLSLAALKKGGGIYLACFLFSAARLNIGFLVLFFKKEHLSSFLGVVTVRTGSTV